jgi:hypothetical protein
MEKELSQLAAIVRSKNAGPFLVTFDVLFNDEETYRQVCESGAVTPDSIARAFDVQTSAVTSFFLVPMANAIKVTLRRPIVQGAFGDSDVYGCQQHVPLMKMRIPVSA